MLHGVSLKHVDNSAIQEAILNKADPNTIVRLKANVAFNCVVGFEYHEVTFEELGNLLSNDVGFNTFKFKDYTKATYNKEKHPEAYGLIRGVANIDSGCSWLWFDIDVTTISDTEMHKILANINHHIARTSDSTKQYKYRVLIELSEEIRITRDEWKPFIGSVADSLGLGKIDKLAMSQVIYGYNNREVLSKLDGTKVDPKPHLQNAKAIVAKRQAEEEEWVSSSSSEKLLSRPYSTFEFAYSAEEGDRWKTSMAAIGIAKKLGASRQYIEDLMYDINNFLDSPKSRTVVRESLFSAI